MVKRTKKKSLGETAEAFQAQHNGACSKKSHCALLSAVVEISKEVKSGPGFEKGHTFDRTGKYKGTELVYFVRRAEYAVVNYCPFCGEKLG